MEKINDIEITITKGDKLFNENTPFVVNIHSPEPETDEHKCNVDLICVIDISGSMMGEKILQVKNSLKILVGMMNKEDRISLVLFDNNSQVLVDLTYLNEKEKKNVESKIDGINANGGTNILSGLEEAVEILKKNNDPNSDRASSVILLSDGCDNYNDDLTLAEALKGLTKGTGLYFTLHTFGYGDDHDPQMMNKLANIRDGSFYYVEDYKKVGEYFVDVLGGCISVISRKTELNIEILKKECPIAKVYGLSTFYSHDVKPNLFKTSMLQFIYGKDYTYVFELSNVEKSVQLEEEIIKVTFTYEDINQNNKLITKNAAYKFAIKDINFATANKEYVRSEVYSVLDEALKERQSGSKKKAKQMIAKMKKWINDNYKEEYKNYLNDLEKTDRLFTDDEIFASKGISYVSSHVTQNMSKKSGADRIFSNCTQKRMTKNMYSH